MNTNRTSTGGQFGIANDVSDIRVACLRSRLAKILAAPIDAAGNWQVSPEDQAWAIAITRQRPWWSVSTFAQAGIQ